jgi:alginate O-acetyltransferase complex protein AlgI
MLFNSFVFAGLFLPVAVLLFWNMPTSASKRAVLLISSLIFYAYWLPLYLPLLFILVGVAWWCARQIGKTTLSWPVWLAGICLFGALGYFKYGAFVVLIAKDLGLALPTPTNYNIGLPLGISFIAFQAMGYVVDVTRREFPPEKSFLNVLLFKAFFPQLIAGPICRAHDLMPQLKGEFPFRLTQFTCGVAIFSLGLMLKVVLADALSPIVDKLFAVQERYSFINVWAAAFGFGFQVFADFWGYSTMAVGLARMFAIEIPVNFNLPYLSTSLREFWRRWHITLSQWLRDYLYKPIGGSRQGMVGTIMALMFTMLLGGLWHGANYTFLLWGFIHGLALAIEHTVARLRPRTHDVGRMTISATSLAGWLYTTGVVFIAWIVFRATNIKQALNMVAAMFAPATLHSTNLTGDVKTVFEIVVAMLLLQMPIEWLLTRLRNETIAPGMSVTIAFWSFIAVVIFGAPVAVPFIYFQF